MKAFIALMRDESGAAAAEYALILAVVGAAIAFAAYNLGEAVNTSMVEAADCITNPPTESGGPCEEAAAPPP